jgi:catechol-2,3-dioxygenase
MDIMDVAFKIGNRIDELREAKSRLEAARRAVQASDHGVSKSIYLHDPDGDATRAPATRSEHGPNRTRRLLSH